MLTKVDARGCDMKHKIRARPPCAGSHMAVRCTGEGGIGCRPKQAEPASCTQVGPLEQARDALDCCRRCQGQGRSSRCQLTLVPGAGAAASAITWQAGTSNLEYLEHPAHQRLVRAARLRVPLAWPRHDPLARHRALGVIIS
jgi:hypothetical protein